MSEVVTGILDAFGLLSVAAASLCYYWAFSKRNAFAAFWAGLLLAAGAFVLGGMLLDSYFR